MWVGLNGLNDASLYNGATFAAGKVGYLSFWEANRDKNACSGALFQCTNVPQQPFEFSKIFAGFRG